MSVPRSTPRGTADENWKACSRCGNKRDRPGQSYCLLCHKDYMKELRVRQKKRLRNLEEEIRRLRAAAGQGR